MSTKRFSENITTRYGLPEKDIYQQVIDLVKKENLAKSRAQLLLVERGLKHVSNPEPLIKTVIKEVPVEKIVKEIVYRDPPQPKSEPKHLGGHIQEHVAMDDHITEEYLGGDTKSEQRPSGDIRTTQDKADPPHNTALDTEKSPKADSDEKKDKGIGGWIALAGFLALIFGPVVYSWVKK